MDGTVFVPTNAQLILTGFAAQAAKRIPGIRRAIETLRPTTVGDSDAALFNRLGFVRTITDLERLERQAVICVTQLSPGRHNSGRHVEYTAFWSICYSVKYRVNSDILFPYRVCCGADGGDFDIISRIIHHALGNRAIFVKPLKK